MNASLIDRRGPRHDVDHTPRDGRPMNFKLVLAGVGLLALLAGTALWVGTRAAKTGPASVAADASPAAIATARFSDAAGEPRSLGQFAGQVVVVNFWATWCAPCREEMPGFVRLQERWKGRVQFVGIANDDRAKVDRFGRELAVNYPLWTGGQEVMELSKRLGNRLGVLPHTVLLDGGGQVLESRIGLFPEGLLEERLSKIAPKSP
jgi:thiol-disulfide isomerase/thioredoxin